MLPTYRYDVRLADGPASCLALFPPALVESIGLPAHAIVGTLSEQVADEPGPDSFKPNPVFTDLLHRMVGRDAPGDPALRAEAARVGNGWLYVVDQRTPNPRGPVPPEDIVGYFAVQDGLPVARSYQGNPSYQLLTGRGLFSLPGDLGLRLVEEVREQGCPHAEVTQTCLGEDPTGGRYADVHLETCAHCGTRWLHYAFTLEFETRSARWYRGRLRADRGAELEAATAARLLESLPHYVAGGDWYGGVEQVRSGPLL